MTAYSRVRVPPVPPASGTTLTVDDEDGAKFPTPPFTALVWPSQKVPTAANSEELAVTAIVGDVLTFSRAVSPISITKDLMVASLFVTPVHTLGEDVTLTGVFDTDDPPYVLALAEPSGSTRSLAATDVGNGTARVVLRPPRAGLYHYRFTSPTQALEEDDFYVPYVDAV